MGLRNRLKQPLALFIVLQLLDLATTLAALALGGSEMNPLVRQLLVLGPVSGLIFAKLVPIGLVTLLQALGKSNGIRKANWVFSGIVVWNLTIIFRLSVAAIA